MEGSRGMDIHTGVSFKLLIANETSIKIREKVMGLLVRSAFRHGSFATIVYVQEKEKTYENFKIILILLLKKFIH